MKRIIGNNASKVHTKTMVWWFRVKFSSLDSKSINKLSKMTKKQNCSEIQLKEKQSRDIILAQI